MRYLKKVFFIISACICAIIKPAFSQVEGMQGGALPFLNQRESKVASPTATSITAINEAQVDLSTGQLNFGIPLYTLKHHDITVPVSMSYHYSGFKPNEFPSWVGAGWSLNAGGVIRRIKKGEADEVGLHPGGGGTAPSPCELSYLRTPQSNNTYPTFLGTMRFYKSSDYASIEDFLNDANAHSPNNRWYYNKIVEAISNQVNAGSCQSNNVDGTPGTRDLEPDEFVFNFCGYSGKFILQPEGQSKAVFLTDCNNIFKAEYQLDYELLTDFDGPGHQIERYIRSFTLYSYDGMKYEFGGDIGNSTINMELTYGPPSAKWGSTGQNVDNGNNAYVSAWYLKKITSATGAEVNFSYQPQGYYAGINPATDIEQVSLTNARFNNYNSYSINVTSSTYLKDITAGDVKVDFISETEYPNWEMSDLFNNPNSASYAPEFAALNIPSGKYVAVFKQILPDYINKLGLSDDYVVPTSGGVAFNSSLSIAAKFASLYVNMCTYVKGKRYNGTYIVDAVPTFMHYPVDLKSINISEKGVLLSGYDFVYKSSRNYSVTENYNQIHNTPSNGIDPWTKMFGPMITSSSYTFSYSTSVSSSAGIDANYPDYPFYGAPVYTFGDSKTGRLELSEIKKRGVQSNQYLPFYSFEYSLPGAFANLPKVEYGTRKIDHWGYFNNKDYFYNSATGQYKDTSILRLLGPLQNIFEADYYNSREPLSGNDNPAEIGALSKITHPTGGTTEITYDWNNYKKRVAYDWSSNAITLVTENANVRAGGIRISSIKNTDAYNNVPVIKNYYYVANFPFYTDGSSPVSSGVLNSGKPKYITNGLTNVFPTTTAFSGSNNLTGGSLSDYTRLSDRSDFPYTFDDDYIIYSKVVEQNAADQSYKVYTFSNSDSGPQYLDKVSQFINVNGVLTNPYSTDKNGLLDNGYPFDFYYSKAETRGKLLKEEFFTATGDKKKSIEYQYNELTPQMDDSAFYYFRNNTRPLGEYADPTPMMAVRTYIGRHPGYYNYLKRKTTKDYVAGGGIVTTMTDYTYNRFRNNTEEIFYNSDGSSMKTTTAYADQFMYNYYQGSATPNSIAMMNYINPNSTDPFTISVDYLLRRGLFNFPVEKITSVNQYGMGTDYVTHAEMYEYDKTLPLLNSVSKVELNAPVSNFVQAHTTYPTPPTPGTPTGIVTRDSRYRDNATVNVYNTIMPKYPLTVLDDEHKLTTIRDYGQKYITAVVKNAVVNDVAYTSFEGDYNYAASYNGSDDNMGNWQFDKNGIVANGITGSKCYNITSAYKLQSDPQLTVGKKYIVSFWFKNGSIGLYDGTAAIPLTQRFTRSGWVLYDAVFTAQHTSITISGNGNIDEVRLYPEAASMESYTYNAYGLTSRCDALNHLEYYTYDNFGRLVLVVNEDGNVVKKYEYGNLVNE